MFYMYYKLEFQLKSKVRHKVNYRRREFFLVPQLIEPKA